MYTKNPYEKYLKKTKKVCFSGEKMCNIWL